MSLANKYLNPQYDISFKRIFGTEKNKELLLNFLNVVLKNQIKSPIIEVVFLKTVQDPEIASKKQSIVDVLCKDTTGVQYIIEMQMTKGSGFEERAQYYAAKAYVNQMLAGDRQYANLKEVIFIAIANYNIFPHKMIIYKVIDNKKFQRGRKKYFFIPLIEENFFSVHGTVI